MEAQYTEGMTRELRPAELAGTWYPRDASACRAALEATPALSSQARWAFGAVVPHGGWRYAARISGGTLARLAQLRPEPDLIVALGGHLEAREAPRLFIEGDWSTPLGRVPTPQALAEVLAMVLSAEPESWEEYYDDNALEVLMPMFRYFWPDVPVLTLGVPPDLDGPPVAREIAKAASQAGFSEPLVVGSVDLTHYGPDHGYRPRGAGDGAHRWVLEDNDRRFLEHLVALRAHELAWDGPRLRNTCSPGAAATAVALAKKLGAESAEVLAHSTSWQEDGAQGVPTSFVGYAGALFVGPPSP